MGKRVSRTPEQLRDAHAARQRRYRARQEYKKQGEEYTDAIIGFGPPGQGVPPPPADTSDRDLAKMVRERLITLFEGMDDIDLLNKDHSHIVNQMLKTATVFDRRASVAKGEGLLEAGRALLGLLAPPPRRLNDGMTVEGEAVEVVDGAAE